MSETTSTTFNLADLRERVGLSKTEVAKRMGVGRPRVGQIEQDFPKVRFNVIEAYIQALGAHIHFLGSPFGEEAVSLDIRADRIAPDPRGPRDHGYRKKEGAVDSEK